MYDPKGNSRQKTVASVRFEEFEPPEHLRGIVHRYLHLQTDGVLKDDYRFHALPDACTYVVFDQITPEIAGIARLQASSEELNLGRHFHFVNIRILPGVWQSDKHPVTHGLVNTPWSGALGLTEVNNALVRADVQRQNSVLTSFVDALVAQKLVVPNPTTQTIFRHIDEIYSVADMADICQISARQLQRNLKRTTGFTPHDFLKVLRLQQSLLGEPSLSYADQSHFIHSFRKATGYTPGQFARKFDV